MKFADHKEELEVYDYVAIREGRRKSELETAKEDGRNEGIEIGEKKAKIEIAKSMLKDNLPIEMIKKYSGLSKEEIERIKKAT